MFYGNCGGKSMDSIGLGSIENELIINSFLLSIALVISIFLYRRKNNFVLGIFVFSALSNLIIYTDSSSRFYDVYNLKWIVKFTLWYWPWINVALFVLLIINLIKNRNAKAK